MPTTLAKKKKKPMPASGMSTGCGNFTESAMDEYLAKKNLYRKPIAKDGSCLFRAVSEQIYNCQAKHLDVRRDCIAYMRKNREKFEEFVEGPFDHHLFKLQNPKEWAGQVEITAIALMYKKDFVVFQDINSAPTEVTDYGFKDKILLCYSNGNHYDAVYSAKFKKTASICQSIVYEMLYRNVFVELEKRETSKKGGSFDGQKSILDMVKNGDMVEEPEPQDPSEEEGWTEVKSRSRAKQIRHAKTTIDSDDGKEKEEVRSRSSHNQKYLWEIRRSLDTEMFRNVALEIWEEEKNELQQQDMTVATTLQYKNGDRCLARLGPPNAPTEKYYVVIVKEDCSGSSTILVYVPELKERQTVPVSCLKPFENQQDQTYKDLSGYYKKQEGQNGAGSDENLRDDGKGKKKKIPRNRRGVGRGDEPGSGPDDAPRGRGRGFGRRGGRFPRGRDERIQKDDEEAKILAEQMQLVEIQEKDLKAFPALPARSGSTTTLPVAVSTPSQSQTSSVPVSPPEIVESPPQVDVEKASTTEAGPDQSPAEFWSRLKNPKLQPKPPSENSTSVAPATSKSSPASSPPSALKSTSALSSSDESFSQKKVSNENKESTVFSDAGNEAAKAEEEMEVTDSAAQGSDTSEKVELPQMEPKDSTPGGLELKTMVDEDTNLPPAHIYETKITGETKILQQPNVKSEKRSSETLTDIQEPVPLMEKTLDWGSPDFLGNENKEFDRITLSTETNIESGVINVANTKDNGEKNENEPEAVEKEPEVTKSSLRRSHSPENTRQSMVTKEATTREGVRFADQSVLSNELYKKKLEPKSVLVTETSMSNSPERKTVTFADETKEIPPKPYYQQQKGILIVNGANNLNKAAVKMQTGMNEMETEYIRKDHGYSRPMYNIPASSLPDDNSHGSPFEENLGVYKPYKDQDPKAFVNFQTDLTGKDQTVMPVGSTAEGVVGSTSPSSQQQGGSLHSQAPYFQLPFGIVQAQLAVDPTGADLPQDIAVLRFFYNYGYQQYNIMCNMMASGQQMVNQPMMYMYPGIPQEQVLQQSAQPVSSLGQQLYTSQQQQQQMLYQQGVQSFHQPFQLQQAPQDNPAQNEPRSTSDRTNQQLTQQPQQNEQQQQQQQPQQQGHQPIHATHHQQMQFQNQHQHSLGQQQWRGTRSHFTNTNKHYYGAGHHGGSPQSPRPSFHQGSPGSPRQPHFSQGHKSRRSQNKGHRNEHMTSHYGPAHSASVSQDVSHTHALPSTQTTYYMPGEQAKNTGEFYPTGPYNAVNYQQHNMTQGAHGTGTTRGPYN